MMISALDFIDGATVGGVTFPPLTLPGGRRIVLSDLQRSILAEALATGPDGLPKYATAALCFPKAGGKSLIAAALLAHRFLCVPDSRSIVLGPTERQATSVVANIFRELIQSTYPGIPVGRSVVENPALGSSVVTVPASEATVQGLRPRAGLVVVDEAHEFPSEPTGPNAEVGGALQLLLSQAEDPESQVLLLGMLGHADGYLHRLTTLADSGEVPGVFFSYECDPLALNPVLEPAYLEARKREMLPSIYAVHFRNEPAESASNIFARELLEAACERGRDMGLDCPVTPEQWSRLQHTHGTMLLAGGLDRAMAIREDHDRTVAVVLARPMMGFRAGAAPVFVLWLDVLPQGHSGEDIIASFLEARSRYGYIYALAADQYQCLDLAQALQRSLGIMDANTHLVHETAGVQMRAFGALGEHLRNGRLVLGVGEPTDYLVRELTNIRAELNRRLDGARFEGRPHDDSCHATAMACLALAGLWEMDSDPLSQGQAEGLFEALREGQATGDYAKLTALEHERRLARESEGWYAEAMYESDEEAPYV